MSASVQVFGRRHDERHLALRRPASKKRQGTKSREGWRWLGSERYGDLILALAMMVGAKLRSSDLGLCVRHVGGGVGRINERWAR
jgi:hypothetical protein